MSGWPAAEVRTLERPIGTEQLLVLYLAENTGMPIDPASLYGRVADDAAIRSSNGWRIASTDTMPLWQMGTTGNILFQSGGGFATQAAIAVVYARRDG